MLEILQHSSLYCKSKQSYGHAELHNCEWLLGRSFGLKQMLTFWGFCNQQDKISSIVVLAHVVPDFLDLDEADIQEVFESLCCWNNREGPWASDITWGTRRCGSSDPVLDRPQLTTVAVKNSFQVVDDVIICLFEVYSLVGRCPKLQHEMEVVMAP